MRQSFSDGRAGWKVEIHQKVSDTGDDKPENDDWFSSLLCSDSTNESK